MALERVFCNVTDFIARGMGIKYSISHSAWCALTPEPDTEREVESFCAGARIKFIPFTETTAIGLFLWCSPLCLISCLVSHSETKSDAAQRPAAVASLIRKSVPSGGDLH
jgi:hypothetical protein